MSKERLSSNAELYISLMMFLVAGILGWQITRITVAQSRLFPLFIFFLDDSVRSSPTLVCCYKERSRCLEHHQIDGS